MNTKTKSKVLFIIPTLVGGGSEKVLSILLRSISKDKYDITLCVLTEEGVYYNLIPNEITKVNLQASRVRFAAFKLYRFINKNKPDVVFVFGVNHLSLIIGLLSIFLPKKIRYITREAVVLSTFIANYTFLKGIIRKLYSLALKKFDLILCQSKYMKADLLNNFNAPAENIIVINNPVEVDRLINFASEEFIQQRHALNLVAVGRIVYVKGFDLLITALSNLKSEDFHLTVLGEKTVEDPGYEEHVLKLVNDFGLSKNVSFLGFTLNPHKYIKNSDLLIVSSRTEAFSNVAIEANTLGVPVVAFNSPGGMEEIIEENFNGWLVEPGNVNELAMTIDKASTLRLNKKKIALHARIKYDVSKIIPQYEELIVRVINRV